MSFSSTKKRKQNVEGTSHLGTIIVLSSSSLPVVLNMISPDGGDDFSLPAYVGHIFLIENEIFLFPFVFLYTKIFFMFC